MANVNHHESLRQRLDRLPAYRDSPIFSKLFGPILDDLNGIEAVAQTLYTWANLSSATGILLERLGELVGIENFNNEISETVFRAFVQAAYLAH